MPSVVAALIPRGGRHEPIRRKLFAPGGTRGPCDFGVQVSVPTTYAGCWI